MIRPLQDTDYAILTYNLNNYPELTKYMVMGNVYPVTVDESKKHHEDNKAFDGLSFAIIDEIVGDMIGVIELHHVDRLHSKGEISIYVWRQGQGHGVRAIDALAKFCFDKYNINKLIAKTNCLNRPCIRSFEKAGFKIEAMLDDELFYNGEYRGMVYLSLVKKSYLKRRKQQWSIAKSV